MNFSTEEPQIEDLTTVSILEEQQGMSSLTFEEIQALENYGFSMQAGGASSTRYEPSDENPIVPPLNLDGSLLDADLMRSTPERDVLALAERVEKGETVDHLELQSSPEKQPEKVQVTPMKATRQNLENRHVTFSPDVMMKTKQTRLPKTPNFRRSTRLSERSSSEKKKDQEPARPKSKLGRDLKAKKKDGAKKKLVKKSK